MPSSILVDYFESLQRCDLRDLNNELHRFASNEQIKSSFGEEGVLIIEHVFKDEEISAAVQVCERLESLVERDNLSYADINLEAVGGGWRGQCGTTESHTGKIRKVMNLIDHGDEYKRMAFHPSLIRIVLNLLGPNFSLHSKGVYMNKPPEVSTEKPWHQDSAYFESDNQIVTVWIPLQDVDEFNGCLYAIPKSHSCGKLQHQGDEAQLDLSILALGPACKYPVTKGSICVMDKDTVHYSGVNKSTSARRALIFRYQKDCNHTRMISGCSANCEGGILQSYCDTLNVTRRAIETLDPEPKTQQALQVNSETSYKIWHHAVSVMGRGAQQLGGAVSPKLLSGELESKIEKMHLIMARVLRQRAEEKQVEFIDVGTDYSYPFYETYKPTQDALRAFSKNGSTAIHYPSSFGLQSLRQAFRTFMLSRFGVNLDHNQIMINTGASQAFDALSRAFHGQYVLLPSLALPTVGIIAAGNGAELLRLPLDEANGMIELKFAQLEVDRLPPNSVRYLYLNSPVNPTGHVASLDYLQRLVLFAKRNSILVVHDMDSWYTQHSATGRLHNILEAAGASDCCITVLSVSKEFGLPGLRVGLIAGNKEVINVIRMHNSTFAVMIPEACQLAVQAALEAFRAGDGKEDINAEVTEVLRRTVEGWRSLGWPAESIYPPHGGFKYLVSTPPGIRSQGSIPGVELLDFYIASRANVKLSTSRSFNSTDDRFLRVVLMQKPRKVEEVFKRLRSAGVCYDMTLPESLVVEYKAFLSQYGANDF